MTTKPRALIAAQPSAWAKLLSLQDPVGVDVILCTFAFDESRMIEFVRAVKADPEYGRIPVLCARILPSVLSDHLIDDMRAICKESGAVDLVDIARLPADKARSVIRSALENCLGSRH